VGRTKYGEASVGAARYYAGETREKAQLDDLECMRRELVAVKTKKRETVLMAVAALEPSEPWRETLLIIALLVLVVIANRLF